VRSVGVIWAVQPLADDLFGNLCADLRVFCRLAQD
jgi:hypothetical protein